MVGVTYYTKWDSNRLMIVTVIIDIFIHPRTTVRQIRLVPLRYTEEPEALPRYGFVAYRDGEDA